MRKINLVFACLMAFVFIAVKAQAQTGTTTYFIGKWDVLVKGLPQGDAHLIFNLADSAGHLKGVLVDTTAAHKDIPLTKVEQADDTATLYFSTQGYDVNLVLKKKDDDHATGSLMGMFDAVADRVKK
jgi:hypothetical protein